MIKHYYMGLDLSLTGAGMVVLEDPEDDSALSAKTGKVLVQRIMGHSLTKDATVKEKTERQIDIAKAIIAEARTWEYGDCELHVAIENYAFSTVQNKKGKSFQSSSQTGLAELHGVVKSQLLLAMGISPVLYSVKTARMVVLGNGNFPKKDVKPKLNSWGYEFKKTDDADAFVIAECHRQKLKGWTDDRKKRKK